MKLAHRKDSFIKDYCKLSPMFGDLISVLNVDKYREWPDVSKLQRLLKNNLCTESGEQLRLKVQDETLPYPEMGYEERIYKTGFISTREDNWHDFFNAMIWGLFPRTKVVLNDCHMQEIKTNTKTSQKNGRTNSRDAITHLDESGVIVAVDDWTIIELLREHHWQDVFVKQRYQWHSHINAFIIGHGLYEKALEPFIGMTGKMYPILMDSDFFTCDKSTQYQLLDEKLANNIKSRQTLQDNDYLSPFPVLGVPGWYHKNEDIDFYENRQYFRAKRKL